MNNILFSKGNDNWRTPTLLYQKYMNLGYFDPCPYNSDFDGLSIKWKELNYVNPPFSKIEKFIDKAIKEHQNGNMIVLLIPARTDTKYFRKLVDYGCDITFITGRLKYNDIGSAPFPSCLISITNKKTTCTWINRNELI